MSIPLPPWSPVSEEQLDGAAAQLVDLGVRHGLSGFRHAGQGRLVADIAPGRTYFDIARFEADAEALLQAPVEILLSQTQTAAAVAGRPLAAPPT